MKRTITEKLSLVLQVPSGVPQRELCEQYHLGQHYLENLVDRYRKYGEKGLERKSRNNISVEKKIALVRDFIESGVTLRKICNENEISKSAFESWIEKARTYGYDSLQQSKKRGRPPKDPMSRPYRHRAYR